MSSDSESQTEGDVLLPQEDVDRTPVYPIIHMIKSDMMHFIDTPLSYEALTAPDISYTLVQPLVEKYLAIQREGNMSVPFCFLLNRVRFIRDDDPLTSTISRSRAELCEILAIRTFREYGNEMLNLTLALTTAWHIYNGADPQVIQRARAQRDGGLDDRIGNAIELAILGKAKRFIKSSSCQRVINAIWTGKCVYQAESSHAILSDTYKRTPIHFYDPQKGPILDHYRLKVPAIRSVLEYSNFVVLFVLFIVALEVNERDRLNIPEIIFMVYALGFSLEKIAAMQERGLQVYFKGTWNGFDTAFLTMFVVYAFLRIYGVYGDAPWARELGIDLLALIACLLFPRLAFVTLRNNLMVLALRAMMIQFLILMLIAAFCFCGFLYALWTLSRNKAGYSASTIAWWMLDLWFGLDAAAFFRANEFHPIFGPFLIVTYACLSNTLLLTVLVSILSNTFANINEDAPAEAMFRKAVSTIEGVKADSLFSYQPPINLLAVVIMLPSRYILSPRYFHKFNVFMIRLTNLPILLLISLYERQSKKRGTTNILDTITDVLENMWNSLPRSFTRLSIFEGMTGPDSDIAAIFEIEDQYESALETSEDPSKYRPSEGLRRRPSPRGKSPSPPKSPSPARQPSPPKTPPKTPAIPSSPPRTHFPKPPGRTRSSPTPRTRANSFLRRGGEVPQGFVSPLAQVFQPLMVDRPTEEVDRDKAAPSRKSSPAPSHKPSPSKPPPQVSYGPATRRLPSVQSTLEQQPTAQADQDTPSTQMPQNPEAMETSGAKTPAPETAKEVISGKPGPQQQQQVGDMSEWTQKLDEMEKRTERIEQLLTQLARDVKRVTPP
ncbi:putative nonselective cation channel [Lyophyllum shimeji]|uniref:Nonselective cation channel n=1 Tax=Lyophyllum shimeji TaxID=47721 RepID=A0A9P3UT88_LYOSH|nr:putative nonselective cation channel [Lyophyllum shimeji]